MERSQRKGNILYYINLRKQQKKENAIGAGEKDNAKKMKKEKAPTRNYKGMGRK